MKEGQEWIIEETREVDFGDIRLNRRYGDILNRFSSSPNKSIPGASKGWKETIAAYRFLNNAEVTDKKIIEPHRKASIERIKREEIVLIAQDTTEIDFTGRKKIEGMGYLSQENSHGFYLHPSIAVTPERICLGVIDMQTWTREKLGTREERKKKPIEEKETYCWLKGYEAANAVAKEAKDTIIVNIADREADIYEVLEKMPTEENKAYWLIRAQHNRAVLGGENEVEKEKIREKVKGTEVLGEIEFTIPAGRWRGQERKERKIKQEIRSCEVKLRAPRRKEKKLESISIYVVHCIEMNPASYEEQIEWLLITSYPIANKEIAMDVVKWYLCRWQIEVFFKILKSGCSVEEIQFETLKGATNCIAMYLIVAWRVLYLTMLGRNCPEMSCEAVFEESEWQSVVAIVTKKPPPKDAPKLNEMILMIAKLGGFLGRKSDGYPGPQVMWIGIQRMRDFTLAWEVYTPMGDKTCV